MIVLVRFRGLVVPSFQQDRNIQMAHPQPHGMYLYAHTQALSEGLCVMAHPLPRLWWVTLR